MSVVALAEYENPGCWDSVIPNLHQVEAQIRQVQKDLGRHFNVSDGVTCVRRGLEDSLVIGRVEELPLV